MPFSDLTAMTDYDWQDVDFVAEFINALVERRTVLEEALGPLGGILPPTSVSVGDDIQAATFWGSMQTFVTNAAAHFLRTVDAAGDPAPPAAGGTGRWSAGSLWAMAVNGDPDPENAIAGPRRYTVHPDDGGTVSYGGMVFGDIIGPWIFEDLQAAIKLLIWTDLGHAASSVAAYDTSQPPNTRQHWYESSVSLADAIANVQSGWATPNVEAWFNGATEKAFTRVDQVGGVWQAEAIHATNKIGLWSSFNGSRAFSFQATAWHRWTRPNGPPGEFNSQDAEIDGSPLVADEWIQVFDLVVDPEDEVYELTDTQFGDHADIPPNWPTQTDLDDNGGSYAIGYDRPTGAPGAIRCRWDVEGGFEYV